jgi:hypothetical protein
MRVLAATRSLWDLPALVPELTYEGMEVADGQAAGIAWESLIGGDCTKCRMVDVIADDR